MLSTDQTNRGPDSLSDVSTGEDAGRVAAEARARVLIDRQLVEAGWSVQDKKAMNLFAAQGVAVREVTPVPACRCVFGAVDRRQGDRRCLMA